MSSPVSLRSIILARAVILIIVCATGSAHATPPARHGTLVGCVQGEKVYGAWKPARNGEEGTLHGTARVMRIVPCANKPLNMEELAGKLVEVMGPMDPRTNAMVCPAAVSVLGRCPAVSLSACVVESTALVTKTVLGPITIEPAAWDQVYAVGLVRDGKKVDLSAFEAKRVRVTGSGMDGAGIVDTVTVPSAGGIEPEGACEAKAGLLGLRASQLYEGKAKERMERKDWKGALPYMGRSIALAPNNCWKYKTRKDIYLALGDVESAAKDLQHFTETLCATSADREELARLRAQSVGKGGAQ